VSPPAWTAPWKSEARKLVSLAMPVAATQLSTMLMGFVDTVMVGRVGVEAIAAVALANVCLFAVLMFFAGVMFGLDPIVSQAHGANQGERAGRALQHGLVLCAVFSLPACLALLATERVLLFFGQDPALARTAQEFITVQIPSTPFFLIYFALRQYLQGREIVRPPLFVILFANGVNAFLCWVFIFGNLGSPALGVVGAGLATAFTRVFMAGSLALLIVRWELYRGAWVPWSRESLSPRAILEVVRYGVPVAFQILLEMLAFGAATLLAGRLGPLALAAHTIALNMASIAFMLPLGVASGAATRVGNLLGAREPAAAQRAAWVALLLGTGVMTASAVAFVALRHWLPQIYTEDPGAIALAATILPIAGAFQIFDGAQVVGCGILRGMGNVRPALLFNLVGYWLLGIPFSIWLGFEYAGGRGWGLPGVWWGLCFGLAVVASLLVLRIASHGPAHLESRLPGAAQTSAAH